MKTIKINRDQIRITEPEIRGLRAVKAAGFVILASDLYERRQGGWGTSLLPGTSHDTSRPVLNCFEHGRQWEVLGMSPAPWKAWELNGVGGYKGCSMLARSLRGVMKSEAEFGRVKAFFAKHPRARKVYVGDPRRINAILRKLDATRHSEGGRW